MDTSGFAFEFSEDALPEQILPEAIPENHSLRRLFRSATRRAFEERQNLYEPAIEAHIADEILSGFVHVDQIHRIKDSSGRRLTDLTELALEGRLSSRMRGLERDLEVHQHAGDYALFLAGLFPESIKHRHVRRDSPLLVYVGSLLVTIQQPMDYYIVEGRSAYSRVSDIYKELDSSRSHLFHRLSIRFEEYLDLMHLIRDYLGTEPGFETVEGMIR
ncbi:MAG: hypothetical protein HY717_16765 [Planctomycetes bacterium]|nr:hypothetical protein [Planctomycetota bacterium]